MHLLLLTSCSCRLSRTASLYFSTILIKNTYGVPIRLLITSEGELVSTEGTTEGDLKAIYTVVDLGGLYSPLLATSRKTKNSMH